MRKKLFAILIVILLIVVPIGCTRVEAQDFFDIDYQAVVGEKVIVDKQTTYLGHPDLVETKSGKMLIAYPEGHGKGAIVLKSSDDFGKTWSERLTTPKSWANSEETPTLYMLDFVDGSSKIILISGLPGWSVKAGGGFQSSVSYDDGLTWSEFTVFYDGYEGIVAMSSLTRVKENGAFIDKWIATFHNYSYENYMVELTFDANGKEVWSTPVKFLANYRDIESKTGMCELEIIRTPDDTLILLARANNKISNSMISFSKDEGKTWSQPKELPNELSGDRHKAEFDKISGKLIISFRHIGIDMTQFNPKSKKRKHIFFGNWVMWVGTYDDLLSYSNDDKTDDKLGIKVIELGRDFGGKADNGYSGTAVRDGKFLLVSYGRFDKKAKVPYILAVKFTLSDMI